MRWLLVVFVGCSGKDEPASSDTGEGDADTDGDTDADTDTDTDADSDTDTDTEPTGDTGSELLPDPYAALVVDECEGGFGTNIYTTWFVGDFTVSGATFSGTETAAVHWSPPMAATCSYTPDCRIVWTITGDIGTPGACGSCDFSMAVSATVDPSLTDCPEDRWVDIADDEWATSYDVKLLADGTSEVYFSSSGNELGGWYWSGDHVMYTTADPLCFLYPDDVTGICL